jgi:hypothetical protein
MKKGINSIKFSPDFNITCVDGEPNLMGVIPDGGVAFNAELFIEAGHNLELWTHFGED